MYIYMTMIRNEVIPLTIEFSKYSIPEIGDIRVLGLRVRRLENRITSKYI